MSPPRWGRRAAGAATTSTLCHSPPCRALLPTRRPRAPLTPPRRLHLNLQSSRAEQPLPDCAPGALPLLEELSIRLSAQQAATLPAGWAAPGVLPALRMLFLILHLAGPLPAEWASGFRRLELLLIRSSVVNVPPSAARRLPEGWGAAFPSLKALTLEDLGITGSLPSSWTDPVNQGAAAGTAGMAGMEFL